MMMMSLALLLLLLVILVWVRGMTKRYPGGREQPMHLVGWWVCLWQPGRYSQHKVGRVKKTECMRH